ncbi:MAG: DUF3828 domain-containing protein [Muribaculaceae bacterium]|nr:DUF3828 domain-containing protein [Muribaculaceae bacterium]
MRKLLLLSVIVVALVACSNRGDVSNATKDQQLDTAAVIQRVEEIYGAVFKVYNEEGSLDNLGLPDERRNEFNALYCSTEWNEAFNKVEEIHRLLNGWWERDYWIMGDGLGLNLSISDIKVVSMDEDKAVVEFQLHNSDSALPVQPVRVIMVKENGIWKIDTFIDQANDDWKKEMQRIIKSTYSHVNEIHSILNEFRKAMEQDWHNLSISDEKVVAADYDNKTKDDDVVYVDLSSDEVEEMDYDYTKADVEFQLHNSGSTQSVRAIMVKKNGTWKIDTFIDEAGKDCKKEMQEYVKQNNHRAKNNK